ncbi:MAG TPA: thymidylate kinase [Acidisarcina sp.]
MRDDHKNPQALLVTFSGIDGAGKSTQISHLRAKLEAEGLTVRLLTFWDDVAWLKLMRRNLGSKIFKGDLGVGTPEKPICRRDKNVRSPLMTVFRLGIYFADAISLNKIARRALRSRSDVVIFDRYIYDELANLNLGNSFTRLYLRAIVKVVPKPEISFFLDADPQQAWGRKPEYPLDFLHANRNAYLKLSTLLGDITVVPPLPLDEAREEIIGGVNRFLPSYKKTA